VTKKPVPGAEYADPKNWHPLAERYPQKEDVAFDELCASIKARGLDERIILLDGFAEDGEYRTLVLDGRARARACVKLGIPIGPEQVELYDDQRHRKEQRPSDWIASQHLDYKPPRTKDTREYDEVHDPGKIPDGQFQTIVADPPWNVAHATEKYPTMPVAAIEAMGEHRPLCPDFNHPTASKAKCKGCGVLQAAADNCHLYLWAINGMLREALDVMDAWGFRYITQVTWNKTRGEGIRADGLVLPDHGGQGVYYRGTTEQILFGVKGQLPARTAQYDTQFYAPRLGGHSVKPDKYFWPMVMRVSPGPYLELFARRLWHELDAAKGDAVWGNQAPKKKRGAK
jgi:N6-adenosine-specific RNA methylase IME4